MRVLAALKRHVTTPRMILRRGEDDMAYLTRWGFRSRLFSIYVHRFDGPDPGVDLHDHPWPFVSMILRGGYTEQRASAEVAQRRAIFKETPRGNLVYHYGFGRFNVVGLGDAHRITHVVPGTFTLVLCGPASRSWGFFTPVGHVDHNDYEHPDRSLVVELPRGVSDDERAELG